MATRTTLSLARLARNQVPATPIRSSLSSFHQTSAAIQCRRTLSTTTTTKTPLEASRSMLAPVPLPFWPVASTQPRTSSGSLGLTRGAGGLVIFRPYHVTLRTLNRQPTNPLHIDDPSTTSPTSTSPPIDDDIQPQHKNPIPPNTDPKARMLIGFTCTVCNHRSHKTMSKHAYDHGVVIMQCDHCKNRHLIADHLGWFKNRGVTVEDLVKERGETVQKLTRSYQLVKDGEMAPPSSSSSSLNADAGEGAETEAGAKRVAAARGTEGSSAVKEKTELELALEKASQGMLEWIPKEILEQEEERMKKSQQSVDHTKKA